MPLFHSGKFRRYDQQPSNSAGNALWDLLSTRNTTIQVNVSYCSRHWENTALCKFFSGYVWPSSKSASLSGHEHSQVRKMKYFFGYFFHTNSTHRPYVPESFHHHLRTQPDFPILPPSQPSQPPAYTQVESFSWFSCIFYYSSSGSTNFGQNDAWNHSGERDQESKHWHRWSITTMKELLILYL